MRRLRNIHIVIWWQLLLVSASVPLSADAQIKIDPKEERTRFTGISFSSLPFSESVKKVTPGKPVQMEGIAIATKKHDLLKPVLVSTERCGMFSDNGPEIAVEDDDFLLRVKAYQSYRFAGRVFAYEVNYEFFDRETGEEVGATTSVFYVDNTGHGTFGIRCGVKDFKLDFVPDWVKKLARK